MNLQDLKGNLKCLFCLYLLSLKQTLSMMKENHYSKMTLHELKTQAKTVKTMMSIFSGILLVLVFAAVFLSFRQGFYAITILFIPVALFPIFFVILNNLNNIKKEIKSRER
jgi:hypothetical protein